MTWRGMTWHAVRWCDVMWCDGAGQDRYMSLLCEARELAIHRLLATRLVAARLIYVERRVGASCADEERRRVKRDGELFSCKERAPSCASLRSLRRGTSAPVGGFEL